MLTIWLNHGKGPYTLDYNYMIVPNVSLEAMPTLIKQYEQEHIFSCVSTNNQFHGVVWSSLKRVSFVLWQNISTRFSCDSLSFQLNVQFSDAGAYLFTETASDFTITVSHPIRVGGIMKVVVNRVGSGQECIPSTSINPFNTTVTLPLPSAPEL